MIKIIHRKIDIKRDRDYILECHCEINYECDCPWKRRMNYEDYRKEWFSLNGQITEFLGALVDSMKDPRTVAEIIEEVDGAVVGYLWAPFYEDAENGFKVSDIQDVYVEKSYRRKGIATELIKYAEETAKQNRADVVRSGTGCDNTASIGLHEKLGFYTYRYEFEKTL